MAGGLKEDTEEMMESMVAQHAAMKAIETEHGLNKRKIDCLTNGVAKPLAAALGKKRKTTADR